MEGSAGEACELAFGGGQVGNDLEDEIGWKGEESCGRHW